MTTRNIAAKTKKSVERNGHNQRPLCYGSFKGAKLVPLLFLADTRFWAYSFYYSFIFNLQSNPHELEKSLGVANRGSFFKLIISLCL